MYESVRSFKRIKNNNIFITYLRLYPTVLHRVTQTLRPLGLLAELQVVVDPAGITVDGSFGLIENHLYYNSESINDYVELITLQFPL